MKSRGRPGILSSVLTDYQSALSISPVCKDIEQIGGNALAAFGKVDRQGIDG